MKQQSIIICLLIACTRISHQVSTPDSETYVAAVVEFSSQYKISGQLTLKTNTDAYIKHIKTANASDVDIIVFPEDGLTTIHLPQREQMDDWTTIIPAASKNYIPCDENTIEVSDTLKRISCAAKENRIYVVINIAEKVPCNKNTCTKYDKVYHNTNVVFDRNGKIIARYRKVNLFVEPAFNTTKIPEIITFDTDFGVKFGTFICFDVLFKIPALYLTRIHQVTDFVYPTAWFSEIPFLTAVQTHSGWAYAEDVNFLVAGYNNPPVGSTGSGIYLGRKGIGKSIMSSILQEKMLVHKVPKMKKKTEFKYDVNYEKILLKDIHDAASYREINEDFLLWKKKKDDVGETDKIKLIYDFIYSFDTFLLEGNVTKTLCQNNFCCNFEIEISKIDPNTKYRLAIYSGLRSFYAVNGSVSSCGIMQCSNQSIESCGSVQQSGTVFKKLNISATYRNYKTDLVMPSTLDSELYPLPVEDWSYDEYNYDDYVHVHIYLTRERNNILTFGLYSRNFVENNASKKTFINTITYFTLSLMTWIVSNFF
ncbi:vanin-like protein 1 [Odontomachus brunneus]|uniref:vanin-like protein 1 n=1 Tax=Odontomachus brunneus TaxID=486640 RepID=UPI0013F2631E|nr:vanin-like protein 1 [Odontomachus brunneus]XP_032668893.1 vanin-like protein 1 [Odontomachus brunneus]XP_032668894.1 vanin-like protein 1 [Odontomachus brunneus]XP_032668895.1 vanin-like protein 1 [Odontomachus brunneus]XP_032668896.1 vanin-like protein 1 [Odontomachus brunneus]